MKDKKEMFNRSGSKSYTLKVKTVKFRLNEEEFESLKKKALEAGKNISTFMRDCFLEDGPVSAKDSMRWANLGVLANEAVEFQDVLKEKVEQSEEFGKRPEVLLLIEKLNVLVEEIDGLRGKIQ